MLPEIQNIQAKDFTITRFLGLNQKDTSDDEMFKDMSNMTSDEYPYLYPREKSAIRTVVDGANFAIKGSVVVGEDLYTVQSIPQGGGIHFYKNFEYLVGSNLNQSNYDERNLIIYGAYIVILPDNVMYNTQTGEFTKMQYRTTYTAGVNLYLTDTQGRLLVSGTLNGSPDASIKVNDTALNTFITNTYGTVFPVYKDKETIHYENDAQTLDIFPAGIVTNNKTDAAAWTDKTSYPIYYITYNSDGKIIVEKYISSMSMWEPIETGKVICTEYTAGTMQNEDIIKDGDFIKANALDSQDKEIDETSATYESYWNLINKFRKREKVNKVYAKKNATRGTSTLDTLAFLFSDTEGLMFQALRDNGSIYSSANGLVIGRPVIGFPDDTTQMPTLCAKNVISKDIPEMDYLTVSNNRIWGCSSVNHEIYSCKQGDATAWYNYTGLASDSYAVTIPSGDIFTGAVTYNDVPYFFTEKSAYCIMGNKPKNFQVQTFDLRGIEDGASKTVAQKDGYVYYKSKAGIERFNGNNSQNLTEYLDIEGLKGFHGQMNNDKYFVFLGKDQDNTRLYVYDVKKRLWHIDRTIKSMPMVELDNNLYMPTMADDDLILIKLNGKSKEIADILTDNDPVYDVPEWFVESGELNAKEILNKYITKCMFELKAEENASLSIYFMYDDSGEWEEVFRTRKRHEKKLIKAPILVRRCERLRYKIKGKGMSKIYSLVLTYEGGSEIG